MDITIDDERIIELARKYGVNQAILDGFQVGDDGGAERKRALDEIEIFLLNAVRYLEVEADDIKDALEIINQFGVISKYGFFADEYLKMLAAVGDGQTGDELDNLA
ncbi:hypothetical protein KA111_01790 [Candidatus Woesebacteria bacterium]|nr:hypothetical protein [Candidatus Woesebacteria bacterium]